MRREMLPWWASGGKMCGWAPYENAGYRMCEKAGNRACERAGGAGGYAFRRDLMYERAIWQAVRSSSAGWRTSDGRSSSGGSVSSGWAGIGIQASSRRESRGLESGGRASCRRTGVLWTIG